MSNDGSLQRVAESILSFFSGFEVFQLPPPSADSKALENMSGNKSQLTPDFLSRVEKFKLLLMSVLVAKQSVNYGDIVTGEGMYKIFRVNDLLVSFIKLSPFCNSFL